MLVWTDFREKGTIAISLVFVVIAGLWTTVTVGDHLMMAAGMLDTSSIRYALLLFLMWWSMMLAMMLPTSSAALLTFARVVKKEPGPFRTLYFALGYAAVWSAFSIVAASLQILTRHSIPFTGMMAVASASIGGVLLLAAGLYQFSPLKNSCLRKCQSPLFYLSHHWRRGRVGAVTMGVSHGLYCFGCCWVLMLLLFYGGVMELTWIVGLACYVAIEKLLPARFHLDWISGAFLTMWGLIVLSQAWGA